MAWSVYSPEDFPKWDEDNNCMVDYRQALGVQVIFHAHQWTTLDDFYRHVRYESWVDAAGEGRESIITGKQLAERLAGDFGSRGLAMADLDKISAEQKKDIESKAEARNMKHRRLFIDRFEQQFRSKMQGGPGRWTPNTYEAECYKLHGLKPPETVTKAPEERDSKPQIIIQQPDPEMIQQMVSQQVALAMEKHTAPSKR
jgi:hypothetical protein